MITYDDEVVCAPRAGTLYDVLELILDRGMVIDVFVRVSLVGIEILKVDARIVVASVDTYLRFAEACNRLDLEHDVRSKTVPELFGGPVSRTVRKGAQRKAHSLTEKVRDLLTPEETEETEETEEEGPEEPPRTREREERGRSPQRSRSRTAARPRGDAEDDDRPRGRRRTEKEDEEE
ncbi:gas vesicle protein GvpJ [Streptomyces viridosporus]|uniref:gas vesicle protein GvpJ n=1 Tax=Streptomyces viridosporus TaxID=67581 RepID=UPI00331A41F8